MTVKVRCHLWSCASLSFTPSRFRAWGVIHCNQMTRGARMTMNDGILPTTAASALPGTANLKIPVSQE